MTNVNYNECDRCGIRDNPEIGAFHLRILDVNGSLFGHLCERCAVICTPKKGEVARD